MRFAIRNPVRAGLCLAIWLCGAPGASAQERGYADLMDRSNFQQSTYHIRVPDIADPDYRIPVVVILHDAGRDGAAIVNDERLVEAFVGKGYAVLAPNALPRINARIHYRGNKPGLMELQSFAPPMTYSRKRFVVTDIDGSIRTLKYGTDSGWYFYNVDQVIYSRGPPKVELLGRDEIQMLRDVLAHAAEEYRIDPNPVLVIGLGHGGSLVWQIACYAPDLSQILAPVGGAFWREIPKTCESGAHLVHTHHRASAFWPLAGVRGSKRRYARTSIYRTLEMLLRENRCGPDTTTDRNDDLGLSHTVWADCPGGGPVGFLVLDKAFDFPAWWLDEMLERIERTDTERPPEAPEVPLETGPAFKQAGSGLGSRPKGSGFRKPGSDAGSRFKRAK